MKTGTDEDTDSDKKGQGDEDKDLNDMLQELRILLQGAQVLTAFLIVLPFNSGFDRVNDMEKWLYLATLVCSISSLVLFTAPAAMHRLARPVHYRERFKDIATGMIITGLVPASLALTLSAQIAVSAVMGEPVSWIIAGVVAAVIAVLWWLIPLVQRDKL